MEEREERRGETRRGGGAAGGPPYARIGGTVGRLLDRGDIDPDALERAILEEAEAAHEANGSCGTGGAIRGRLRADDYGVVRIPLAITSGLYEALERLSRAWPALREEGVRRYALYDLLVAMPDPRFVVPPPGPRFMPFHEVACAAVQKRPGLLTQHRVGVQEFVLRLQAALPVGACSYIPHKMGAWCTMVWVRWPEYVLEAAAADRLTYDRVDLVDYATGRAATQKREREHQRVVRAMSEVMVETPDHLPEPVRRLQADLNSQSRKYFSARVNARGSLVRNEIERRHRAGGLGAEQVRSCHAVLDAIDPKAGDPLPRYKGVRDSVRLYPTGLSLLNGPGWMRRTFLYDALEVDLRSCHAAVLASLWPLPTLHARLGEGSLWGQFVDHLVRELGPPGYDPAQHFAPLKDAVKSGAFYPAGYGAGKERVRAMGDPEEEGEGYADRKAFVEGLFQRRIEEVGEVLVEEDVFEELFEGRSRRLAEIEGAGHVVDVFGTPYWLMGRKAGGGKARTPLTLLAIEAQAIETFVMLSVYEEACRRGARTVLWQHDGCSIAVRDKRETEALIRALARSVQGRLRLVEDRLGVPRIQTGLEVKHAEGDDPFGEREGLTAKALTALCRGIEDDESDHPASLAA